MYGRVDQSVRRLVDNLVVSTGYSLKMSQIPVFYAVQLSLYGSACVQRRNGWAAEVATNRNLLEFLLRACAVTTSGLFDGKCSDDF